MTIQLCAHYKSRALVRALSAQMKSTHEPWDEVQAPYVMEASLVRPRGEEEKHAADDHVGDDDGIPCNAG